jgi:hypothetical protein
MEWCNPEGRYLATYRPLGSFLPQDRFRSHQQVLQRYRPLLVAERQSLNRPDQILQRVGVTKLLNRLDQGLLVLGLAITALDSCLAHCLEVPPSTKTWRPSVTESSLAIPGHMAMLTQS